MEVVLRRLVSSDRCWTLEYAKTKAEAGAVGSGSFQKVVLYGVSQTFDDRHFDMLIENRHVIGR